MYPGFAKTARDEGFAEIAEWFETLARAEKSHAGRFQQGLEALAETSACRRLCVRASAPRCHLRRPGSPPMTTTYDPKHPTYFDEADVRDEMTRVFDLCHGCRLCFKFCTSFPTLFEIHRPPRRPGRRPAHAGPAGPGRRRVLPVQALLRQLPVHPRAARVGDRLPAADAARRRDAPRRRSRAVRSRARHRRSARPDRPARQGRRRRPRRSPTGSSAPSPARCVRKVVAKATGVSSVRLLPPYARQRFSTWFKHAAEGAHRRAARRRSPCSRRASSSTRTRRSARTS